MASRRSTTAPPSSSAVRYPLEGVNYSEAAWLNVVKDDRIWRVRIYPMSRPRVRPTSPRDSP